MQQIELELAGGGVLTVSLRASLDAMPAVKQRPLVLVVPGGGYNHVSPREGDPVALQFAAAGYHTAVLTYSVGEGAQNYQPLRQLNEALALLRQNAGEWHILPDKIAVCGFSAGGHLALSGAVLDIPGETAQQRPNAVILGYPVVTAGEFAHRGSFVQLAGSEDAAAQHRLQQLPERGKVRLAAHLFRRDAGQRDIERIKVRLRVDKRVKLLHDLAALDHADADGAHAPVLRVRRFHVERHITFFHSSTPFDRMEPV